jgi:hypothetical protein
MENILCRAQDVHVLVATPGNIEKTEQYPGWIDADHVVKVARTALPGICGGNRSAAHAGKG